MGNKRIDLWRSRGRRKKKVFFVGGGEGVGRVECGVCGGRGGVWSVKVSCPNRGNHLDLWKERR